MTLWLTLTRRHHAGGSIAARIVACLLLLPLLAAFDSAAADPGLVTRPADNTCVAPQRPVTDSALDVKVVADQDISWPWKCCQAPGDPTRWYVVDRSGYVAIYSASNFAVSAP